MSESDLSREIMKAVTEAGGRVFRNQVGLGWYGKADVLRRPDGSLFVSINGARPLHAGLCEGSSDLIGFYRGRFLAIEVKTPGKDSTSKKRKESQGNFIDQVRAAGGIGIIARSVAEVLDALKSS